MEPSPPPTPAPNPITANLSAAAITQLLLFVGVIVGSVGPWATLLSISRGGMDMDGRLTLAGGIIGVAIAVTGLNRWGKYHAIGTFLVGAPTCGVGIYNWIDIANSGDAESVLLQIEPGWGLMFVTILAGIAAFVGVVSRPPVTPRPANPSPD